jgi:uncharacterized protein YegJ (DUF2314 family)
MASSWPRDEWPFPEIESDLYWTIMAEELWGEIMSAQATYEEFASIVDLERFKLLPSMLTTSVKVFLSSREHPFVGEHVFADHVSCDRDSIIGTINADSIYRDDLHEGDIIRVPKTRLSDWFLVSLEGKGIGGFSLPHVLSEIPEEDQSQITSEPPFAWFSYRNSVSAADQLAALPVCVQCGRRNILDAVPFLLNSELPPKKCGLCQNGIRRLTCSTCGIQILRPEGAPKQCAGCLHGRPVPTWEPTLSAEPRKPPGFSNDVYYWE